MKSICILFAIAGAAFSQTAELDALTAKKNAAVAQIDATYKVELGKLKAKYIAAGNLDGANAAAKLAGESVAESSASPSARQLGNQFEIVGSAWNWAKGEVITFTEDRANLTRKNDTIECTWKRAGDKRFRLTILSAKSSNGRAVADIKLGQVVEVEVSRDGETATAESNGAEWMLTRTR